MSDEKFLAELAAKFERETQVYLGYVNVDRAEKVRAIATRLAALTAENAQLRETLTLGLGEQESVIAGLRAENERLTERLRLVDRIAAGLPSSRETTDGRTDPS